MLDTCQEGQRIHPEDQVEWAVIARGKISRIVHDLWQRQHVDQQATENRPTADDSGPQVLLERTGLRPQISLSRAKPLMHEQATCDEEMGKYQIRAGNDE